MTPFRTNGCNTIFTADGCDDLPACVADGFISTYWKPSAEDLVFLAAGFPIKLSFIGDTIPPCSIEVETL